MADESVHVVGVSEAEAHAIRDALLERFEVIRDRDAGDADPGAVAVIHGGTDDELKAWATRHPHMARVRVSDAYRARLAVAQGSTAHEHLVRPISAEPIRQTLERALYLGDLLSDRPIRDLVSELGTLPALPSTYQALCSVLVREHSSLRDAARVIERDVAVSSRVLQLVNSAMYGLPRAVASMEHAVSLLGLRAVQDLVLAVEVFGEMMPAEPVPGVSLEAMQSMAHATGTLARVLASPGEADHAYMAGLLSHIGRMVLAAKAPDRFRACIYLCQTGMSLDETEEEVFGVRSRDLGAWLLALWGLPWEVVDAVRTGDAIPTPDGGPLPVAGAVYLAAALMEEALTAEHEEPLVVVTRPMVEPWGLRARVRLLRGLAQTLARGLDAPPTVSAPPVMAA